MSDDQPNGDDLLTLLDWKRQIHELYASVRTDDDPKRAWMTWRRRRDELFRDHPQSPLPPHHRATFSGITYFDYDPQARVEAAFTGSAGDPIEAPGSSGRAFVVARRGSLAFDLYGGPQKLEMLWIEGYGGGAFVPFRDATRGKTTYGGGRYILDTIKGADLGMSGDRVILDFNFAYNPSCSYDPRWACPLAPPPNHLDIEIPAGERQR